MTDTLAPSSPATVTPPSPSRTRRRRRTARVLTAVWAPLALLALWWVLSASSTSPFFPPLSRILTLWWEEWVFGPATAQLAPSIRNLLLGYLLGAGIGVVAGTVLWRFRSTRVAANPLVYFLYVLPAPALLPALMALFGVGETRQIALIAFGAIWPTLLNTLDGMRGIDEVKFDTARAMRLGRGQTLFQLVLPAAAPQMAAGLRASLQTSIILMVVSEMVGARQGIGYYILQAQTVFAVPKMWTGIIMLAIVGTTVNLLFVVLERRILAWHHRSRALGSS
ncbi:MULTISPECIES: ABC transporter permease [Pseudonocardia]|uniref:Nitrate ABC transporter permease n=2 Tax=Pseudonocardia TaxID=1847 RepID=A0ABQ0S3L4_9PSEU|nr:MULTISPECIES: ABC transporter permease subunit [Pseudonocardia]OSY35814.1 putative aliphatic sulfonates transport permease protein SsuC [Pseudonocardia autotrophica]TDN73108.1 ABC-type nitrate/sulfonate/bicarbonate transport system permease component [Pseudonocardia autotrophica]BBG03828.1 nitrate ABC transporter permease [Pseudonocardia autotrophica]GEC27373.1 nitrate ABC transporter permease [Pseudonocardia saturnea]